MTDLFTDADQTVDPNKDYYVDLVGADKKFKTPQELARAKAESDAYIKRLETEGAGLRTELQSRQRLEELIDKLKPSQTQAIQPQVNNQPPVDGENRTAITAEQIDSLISKKIDEQTIVRTQQNNLNEVKTALTAHYGSDYSPILNAEAQKLGMTKEEVTTLAVTKPKAFLKLFGIGEKKAPPPSQSLFSQPQSSINTDPRQTTGDRTKAFYDQIRKTNPSEYWTPKVQNAMHNDAIRLGDSFYT